MVALMKYAVRVMFCSVHLKVGISNSGISVSLSLSPRQVERGARQYPVQCRVPLWRCGEVRSREV